MSVKQLIIPGNRAFNSDGAPEVGATASLYLSGTSTPALFYSDVALTQSIGSTITANAAGRFHPMPYGDDTIAYRLVISDKEGSPLDDIDPFYFGNALWGTITGASGSSVSTIALLAAIASPVNGQTAYLSQVGRAGTFVFSTANMTTSVTNDPTKIYYVAPSTDTTGASGAWARLDAIVTPYMAGAIGDGVTDDHVALTAFDTWFFASVRSNLHADFTGTFATTQTITIGPSVATDQNGPRYNIGGNLRIVATAAMDVIIKPLNMRSITWHGCIEAVGTGGSTWSSRTCGIGILPTNCANSTFTGFKVQNTYYEGVLNSSDASNFSDGMHIGFLTASFCGSGITTSSLGQTANWSSPVNNSTSGAFNQTTTLTVDSMPPVLIDTYSTWGSNSVLVNINGEPYAVQSVDRVNNKITIYRWLDSAVLALGSGSLSYFYGGGYSASGSDSGIITIDHLQLVDCGIGLDDRALYGSRVNAAIIESCGAAVVLGSGKNSSHISSSFDAIYFEGNTFDTIWNGANGANDYSFLTSCYNIDITKCWSLADPRLTNDLYGGFGGAFGSTPSGNADTSTLTLAVQGRLHAYHGRSQHNPVTSGTIQFYGHTRAPEPKLYDANTLTIQLVNVADGKWNNLFGFRHNILWISGSGTKSAPTGTITVSPPTKAITGCTVGVDGVTVTIPFDRIGTRRLAAGMGVAGTGIAGDATVSSVTNRTTFVLSSASTPGSNLTLTITGLLNGVITSSTYANFNGPLGLLIAHTDPWEMQWEYFALSGVIPLPIVQKLTSAATVTPDASQDQVHITAQAVALTLANPTGTPVSGQALTIRLKDNGTGRAITYGTQYRSVCSTVLPTTTVAGKIHTLKGNWNGTDSMWDFYLVAQQA